MERARVAEMRSEAAAQSGAARSKEDHVRILEAARAEAEARAAGHAADAEVVRMHVSKRNGLQGMLLMLMSCACM
jgi:oral-facial-digital syndrome 1 protein